MKLDNRKKVECVRQSIRSSEEPITDYWFGLLRLDHSMSSFIWTDGTLFKSSYFGNWGKLIRWFRMLDEYSLLTLLRIPAIRWLCFNFPTFFSWGIRTASTRKQDQNCNIYECSPQFKLGRRKFYKSERIHLWSSRYCLYKSLSDPALDWSVAMKVSSP